MVSAAVADSRLTAMSATITGRPQGHVPRGTRLRASQIRAVSVDVLWQRLYRCGRVIMNLCPLGVTQMCRYIGGKALVLTDSVQLRQGHLYQESCQSVSRWQM